MPRRRSLLIAAVAVCAAVAIVRWQQTLAPENSFGPPHTIATLTPAVTGWNPHPAETGWAPDRIPEPADPAAAVDAILDIRAQFGSVLTDSELAVEGPGNAPSGGAESFDEILRVTAGVATREIPEHSSEASPPDELDGVNSTTDISAAQASDASDSAARPEVTPEPPPQASHDKPAPLAVAESMRHTAALLTQQADQARDHGDSAQQRRFSALATLLEAEADALAVPGSQIP